MDWQGTIATFIKGLTLLVHPLYKIQGNKVKMGPGTLPPEAQDMVGLLKEKIQSTPVLVFPDFDKPFLLETDASKEGLGVQCSLKNKMMDATIPWHLAVEPWMPSKENYHSSKLDFLALKWSVTEYFKEFLACTPIHSAYGQQSTDRRADNTKLGRDGTLLVWSACIL